MRDTLVVATFPRDDSAFGALVRATLAELPAGAREDPEALQRALHRWHTRAMVRYRTAWLPAERVYDCRWRELAVIPGPDVSGLLGEG